MISGLFKTKSKPAKKKRDELLVGKYNIVLNSRGLIPAIIQKKGRSEEKVISLAYLNKDALEMSLASGELYVFRRSMHRIQKIGEDKSAAMEIESIRLAKNHRALLITLKSEKKNLLKKTFIHEIFSRKKNDLD